MTMRAVGYRENLDVGDPASLVDVTMPVPLPGPHDLLARVRAESVNPIDTKIRRGSPVAGGAVRILGFGRGLGGRRAEEPVDCRDALGISRGSWRLSA
jgi:hypothetical protein